MATPINTVTCVSLTSIDGTDCIGDSRVILNNNITNLGTTVCYLSTLINALSSNMSSILNVPYAEYAWVTAPNTAADTVSGTPDTWTKLRVDTSVVSNSFGSLNASSYEITLVAGTYRARFNIPWFIARPFPDKVPSPIAYLGTTANVPLIRSQGHQHASLISGVSNYWNLGLIEAEGQFTIATSTTVDLRFLPIGANSTYPFRIGNHAWAGVGPGDGPSTNTDALTDQRTTVKFWKLA